MARNFKVEISYKGYTHRASDQDSRYENKSSKTNHIAMHKVSALKKLHDCEPRGGQATSVSGMSHLITLSRCSTDA